jgi:hypothetical protein
MTIEKPHGRFSTRPFPCEGSAKFAMLFNDLPGLGTEIHPRALVGVPG